MNIIKHIPLWWLLYAVLSLVVVGCSDTSQEAKQEASTEDVGDGDGDAGSSDITEGVADADGGGVGDTSPEDGGGEPDDTDDAGEDVAEDVVEDVRDSSLEDIPPDALEGDAALEDAMGDTGGDVEDTEVGREDAAEDTEADMTDGEGCGECAENASCVEGVCVCDEGYEGDGSLCERVPVCVCDQWIESDARTFDASDAAPGTTLCLRPGTRNMLLISNVSGSEGAPVVIASCEGSVHINAPTTGNVGLSVSGDHWRLTGAGLEGVERSVRVSAPEASRAVSVGRATHYEIDHIEIDASGFAGIMAKVDPGRSDCRDNDRRFDPYVMQGVSIHHNYIHDVDGEGIYLGNSFYGGNFSSYCGNNENCDWSACDAQWPVRLQYPHPVRGVRVFANLIEDTGWDGIQVGSADEDCTIEGNVVRRWGQDAPGAHQNGIQVGDGSSCDVLSNRLEVGPNGMHLAGIGEVLVANNVLVGIGQFGMNPNPRPPCGGSDTQNACDEWIRPYPKASIPTHRGLDA
ncbi:MAG: right-handed parallel beta-helix repeat-containing protein, partial [Myxococcota bacterium]